MITQDIIPSGAGAAEDRTLTETNLGRALVLLHRLTPYIDEPGRAVEVQNALLQAAASLDAARLAHGRLMAIREGLAPPPQRVATGVAPEIAAVIAAAVAVVVNRPYRLVSVQPSALPTPQLNVWALEGRTHIFHSHKVR